MRFLFRVTVLAALLAGGAYLLGYRWDDASERARAASAEAGAAAGALVENVESDQIRAAGAEIAGKVGEGAGRAEAALAAARLTAKIKAKMALDDTLDASRINVDTDGTVVTVRGSVGSATERRRALQLARETEGVTSVVDRVE